MKKHAHNKGFTLIELLVVIAIIAVLTGVIITDLLSSRSKARDAQRISDLGQIQLALNLYYDRCGVYPSGNGSLPPPLTASQGCPTNPVSGQPLVTFGSYISKVPVDPINTTYNGVNYVYTYTPNGGDYVLQATLESQNGEQANSLPSPSWYGGNNCYDGSSNNKYYCLGPK